jgi:hypothetical protein
MKCECGGENFHARFSPLKPAVPGNMRKIRCYKGIRHETGRKVRGKNPAPVSAVHLQPQTH